MPPYAWLIVFHPILVTILTLIVLVLLLRWTGWWARYRYRILATLLVAYAIDAAFALPRILFAHGLSKGPSIAQQIPLPRRLVLVDVPCGAKCHDWLITGAVDEIISITAARPEYASAAKAVRYSADWTLPGDCPRERARENRDPNLEQRQSGYCPRVEPTEMPEHGVFLIREGMLVAARQSARAYRPTYLAKAPPGPVIRFFGIEVQDRTSAGTTLQASAYRYEAPGLLGLPPLIGCWDRPDNVIWIMPAGDTGCGFWRRFTSGGDDRTLDDPKWLFEQAFGPPDREISPPKRTELLPATPQQALEILSKVRGTDIDFHLPGLRNALLDPAIPDEALTDLIVRRNRTHGEPLEGSLIAFLGAHRPAALIDISSRLDRMPGVFARSGAVLDEMERNAKFREDFADTMFLALQSRWETPKDIGRFLKLMESSHPGWLCDKLSRSKNSAETSKILENDAVKRSSTQCNR
jgi:hypothetical protein